MLRITKRKGQSILEYTIVLAAIVAAILVASKGVIKNAISKAMNDSANLITNSAAKLNK